MPQKHTALTKQNLQIYPTERLDDSADGGGLMVKDPLTGRENELFTPISDVARTVGALNLRSVHGAVRVPENIPLGGAHMIISRPPKAENVSYLLYKGVRYGELRKDIIKRIEAYAVATIESRMTLLSTQSLGSRIVQAYQRPGEPLPLIGDVYCLRQDKAGYPAVEQYVQVIRVSSEDRTFTTPDGKEFVKTVVKMETSTALTTDFIGVDYPEPGKATPPCKIRETHIADGAQYYGVKPLTADAKAQALKIRVPTLMEKLVPTAQVETALTDLTAAGQAQILAASSGGSVICTASTPLDEGKNVHLGNAILPGSLQLTAGGSTVTDRGGTLYAGDQAVGSIDYPRGVLSFSQYLSGGSTWQATFRAAAEYIQVADSASITIVNNNRGYNYVQTINPAPAPGSLQVSYRAQGRWYDLRDDGSGALRGAGAAHGSGSLNYGTGTVSITCGELPDVGSEILYTWGTTATVNNRSSERPQATMLLKTEAGVAPGSLRLAWTDNGAKTAQDDGAGNITGAWTGTVDYRTGDIRLSTFPGGEKRLDVQAQYSVGEPQNKEFKAPLRDGQGMVSLNLGQTQIKPRSFRMTWNLLIEDYDRKVQEGEAYLRQAGRYEGPLDTPVRMSACLVDPYKTVHDDGAGKVVDDDGTEYGTIDYTRGIVKFKPDTTVKIPKPIYRKEPVGEKITGQHLRPTGIFKGADIMQTVVPFYRLLFDHYEYVPALASAPIDDSFLVTTSFRGQQSEDARTKTLTSGVLAIDLMPTYSERIVPGSVRFTLGGETYTDRSGNLYYRMNTATGAATKAGTINYETGIATVELAGGTSVVLQSLAGTATGNPVDSAVWRVPSAPVRPQSIVIAYTPLGGSVKTVRADAGGKIEGAGIEGYIDYETGVVRVRFGQLVDAAGNEDKYWYNPNAVDNGKIWQPIPVYADIMTYSAVSYAYLPLDTAVIGIDAVRLPPDGRVPIFRRGDMIVIGHRLEDDLGSAHTAGQTVQLSRGDLDDICLRDAKGVPIEAKWYDYDLQTGRITWATPLDLSAYTLPVKAGHSREEENRITAVDIDGTLTLQFPIRRDYPKNETHISSALIGGDLQCRVSPPFSQKNFDNIWDDAPRGDTIAARLNSKDFPFRLSDDGAVTDRWAIVFKDGNQFELYSEAVGFVGKFDTLSDLAPINPATGKPYFTLPKGAFGITNGASAWAAGNAVRFNTYGTHMGVWVIRAVQPSARRQNTTDGFMVCLRGNTTEI